MCVCVRFEHFSAQEYQSGTQALKSFGMELSYVTGAKVAATLKSSLICEAEAELLMKFASLTNARQKIELRTATKDQQAKLKSHYMTFGDLQPTIKVRAEKALKLQ